MKLSLVFLFLISWLHGATLIVNTSGDSNEPRGLFYSGKGDLRGCLNYANESNGTDFELIFELADPVIKLNEALSVGNFDQMRNIRIDGSNKKFGTAITVDGQEKYRAFFVNYGNVTIENMTVQNTFVKGVTSSGGGLGAGAGLFVFKTARVTLKKVAFTHCIAQGGDGSFGGWGIGGSYANEMNGGDGGFGGGGGCGPAGVPGKGGIGAGHGSLCAGGGGAGLGGAIFVMQDEGIAGSLTLRGNVTIENCSVIPGNGGCLSATAGAAAGPSLFLMHGMTLLCNPGRSEKIALQGVGDDSPVSLPPGNSYTPGNSPGAGVEIFGDGELILSGENTYLGETDVRKGTLTLAGSMASPVNVGPFGLLKGEGTIAGPVTIQGTATGVFQVDSARFESQSTFKVDLRKPTKLTAVGDAGIAIEPDALLQITPEVSDKNQYHILHSEKGMIIGAHEWILESTDPTFDFIIDPASTDHDLYIRIR